MGKFLNWYKEKIWNNIWYWRIVAIVNIIFFIGLVLWILFEVIPTLDKATKVIRLFELLGLT